jgi:uncharacterized protein YbaR (Trm112 family)
MKRRGAMVDTLEERFLRLKEQGCPTCSSPLEWKFSRSDRLVSASSSSLHDDIYEEISYQEVEELICETCNLVVARKEREVEMERSWYSMRQEVKHGEWQYTFSG